MAEIRVRAMEPEDIPAIAGIMNCPRVIRGTLQLPFRSVAERRERWTSAPPGSHRLVAECDGRVVGMLGLHRMEAERVRHVANFGMAVHDDYQGQGVGSALMDVALDLADRWLGILRIELEVYADNAPAVALYKKYGFEIEGTLRRYAFRDGEYVDAYKMARLRS